MKKDNYEPFYYGLPPEARRLFDLDDIVNQAAYIRLKAEKNAKGKGIQVNCPPAYITTSLNNFVNKELEVDKQGRRRRELRRDLAQLQKPEVVPKGETAKEWVRRTVVSLPRDERWLIVKLFWKGCTLSGLAKLMKIGRKTLERERNRIFATIRAAWWSQANYGTTS